MKKKMSSDCTQQHVGRQGLAENENEGFFVNMSRKGIILTFTPQFSIDSYKLFISCNKIF